MKTFFFHKVSENPSISIEISQDMADDNPRPQNSKLQLADEAHQLARLLKAALPQTTWTMLVAELRDEA